MKKGMLMVVLEELNRMNASENVKKFLTLIISREFNEEIKAKARQRVYEMEIKNVLGDVNLGRGKYEDKENNF